MFLNYKILQNINKYNNLINYGGKMSYKVPDSITARVQQIAVSENKKKKYSDLYNKLDQVNNKFSTNVNNENLPDSITLDRIDFKKPSNEEIKLNSENLLADYKNSGIKNIEDNYKLKYDELNSNKSEAINQTENTKNNLKQYYENAKTNAEYEASKRGLNRSSIIVNQLDAFSNAEINDYKELDQKLGDQINAINFEINALSSQKQNALNSFNISYAVKLQEKIDELNTKLSKTEQEVIKYNNDIALKEAEYNKEISELKQKFENDSFDSSLDLAELYGKYGSGVIEKVKQDQLLLVAKQYLLSLPSSEQQELLNDQEFKNKLGSSYNKLISELNR